MTLMADPSSLNHLAELVDCLEAVLQVDLSACHLQVAGMAYRSLEAVLRRCPLALTEYCPIPLAWSPSCHYRYHFLLASTAWMDPATHLLACLVSLDSRNRYPVEDSSKSHSPADSRRRLRVSASPHRMERH